MATVMVAMAARAYSPQDGYDGKGDDNCCELPLCIASIGGVEHSGGNNIHSDFDPPFFPSQTSYVWQMKRSENVVV